MYTMGLDLGTQGVRAVVADAQGKVLACAGASYEVINTAGREGWKEQDPSLWWRSARDVMAQLTSAMGDQGLDPGAITALAIDGTSGTILPVDEAGRPLMDALCYNDQRSDAEAREVQQAGEAFSRKMGYRFNSSYALPKILWIRRHRPDIAGRVRYYIHHADYITGMLTGVFNVTDYSNALKTGYDLVDLVWPDFIAGELGIDPDSLPRVAAPGAAIATVSLAAAAQTGLSTKTVVVAGATDGYCSAIASGIRDSGDFCTTIGTTMVIKGITDRLIRDDQGRIYCHLHPEGLWIPGGASNTGGICLNHRFDKSLFAAYDRAAASIAPSGVVIYPLVGQGERFPFKKAEAREFMVGECRDDETLYTALLEGVGYTERLSYDMLKGLGCPVGDTLYTAGGAVRSRQWNQIRADILNRRLLLPEVVEAAMGSAILAASRTLYGSLREATAAMVRIAGEVLPDPARARQYRQYYGVFTDECVRRGYIDSGEWL